MKITHEKQRDINPGTYYNAQTICNGLENAGA